MRENALLRFADWSEKYPVFPAFMTIVVVGCALEGDAIFAGLFGIVAGRWWAEWFRRDEKRDIVQGSVEDSFATIARKVRREEMFVDAIRWAKNPVEDVTRFEIDVIQPNYLAYRVEGGDNAPDNFQSEAVRSPDEPS